MAATQEARRAALAALVGLILVGAAVACALVSVDSGSGGDPSDSPFRLRSRHGGGTCLTRVACSAEDRHASHTCSAIMLPCSAGLQNEQWWLYSQDLGLTSANRQFALAPATDGPALLLPSGSAGGAHVREMAVGNDGGALAYWYGLPKGAKPPFYSGLTGAAHLPRGAYVASVDGGSTAWSPQAHRSPAPVASILFRDYR